MLIYVVITSFQSKENNKWCKRKLRINCEGYCWSGTTQIVSLFESFLECLSFILCSNSTDWRKCSVHLKSRMNNWAGLGQTRINYNRRNLTSNIATTNAGYRATVYHALCAQFAAERTHDDACIFTTHQ